VIKKRDYEQIPGRGKDKEGKKKKKKNPGKVKAYHIVKLAHPRV
jgi:hypothetical protein